MILGLIYLNYTTETFENISIGQEILDSIIKMNGEKSKVFGLCGAEWYPLDKVLQDYIDNDKLEYIHVSNESSGVYQAAYYGYTLGQVGVVLTTGGPGAAMAITGIAGVFNEEKPLVCICGESNDNFQFIDPAIMKPVCKHVFYIDSTSHDIPKIMEAAFDIAKNGTKENPGPGPVAIFVRVDLWQKVSKGNKPLYNKFKKDNINNFINNIQKSIKKDSKIIIRVGDRLTHLNTLLLAEITKYSPNVYLNLVFPAKNKLDIFKYHNSGIEGPMGNTIVNHNYSEADIIIEIGVGIVAVEYGYEDISEIKNIPLKKNAKIFSIYDENLKFIPKGGNRQNLYTDSNYFVNQLMLNVNFNNDTQWENQMEAKNKQRIDILDKYLSQEKNGTLTTAAVTAWVIKTLYGKNKLYLDDNNLYTTDVGAAAFIAEQLLFHRKIKHVLSFDQYSQIGCSPPAASGMLMSGYYKDLVLFIGDGAFLNSPGYFIDLGNTIRKMNCRCLLVLLNDNTYSNVALGEVAKFNETTTITSTKPLQEKIDLPSVINTLCGGIVNYVREKDLKEHSERIKTFTENWYNKSNGFHNSGMYLIYYETNILPSLENVEY